MTITEFLLARIDEDDAVARETIASRYDTDESGNWEMVEHAYEGTWPKAPGVRGGDGVSDEPWAVHVQRHSPARVLAECEAKRRIAQLSAIPDHEGGYGEAMQIAAKLIALPYSDHPNFREEWRA